MTPRTRLAALLLGGAAILIAAAVWFLMQGNREDREDGPGWPPSERAAFLKNCVEQCRKSPGVTEDKYPLCDRACSCGADEGEKIMTARELAVIAQALNNGTASAEQTAKMNRVKAAGMSCVTGTAPSPK